MTLHHLHCGVKNKKIGDRKINTEAETLNICHTEIKKKNEIIKLLVTFHD